MFNKSGRTKMGRTMRNAVFGLFAALSSLLCLAGMSEAAGIKVVPSTTTVVYGQSLTVDIVTEGIPAEGLGTVQFRLNVSASGAVVTGVDNLSVAKTTELSVVTPLLMGPATAERSGLGDFFWSGIGPNGILAADNETLQNGTGLFTFGHTNGAVLPTGSGTVARFIILVGEQMSAAAANLSITLSDVMLLNGTEAYSVDTITDAAIELRCMTSVPDLRGLSLTEATSALQTAHLSAGSVSETDNSGNSLPLNVVLEQSTPAGTSVLCGSSVNLTINTPPADVTDLTATDKIADESGTVLLSWTPSTSPDTAGYRIYRTTDTATLLRQIDNAIANGSELAGLTNGQVAQLKVTAFDTLGNESPGVVVSVLPADDVAPTVIIGSPSAGSTTNDNTPLLFYAVSDGTVLVKVDGITASKVSGDSLDTLTQGEHAVRVESTDAAGNMGFDEVAFTVNAPPLVVGTTQLAPGLVGHPYSQALAATGGAPSYMWSIASGSLPAGLTLDGASGMISGTPTMVGRYALTVQVADTAGGTASKALTLVVNDFSARAIRYYPGIGSVIASDKAGNYYVAGCPYGSGNSFSVTKHDVSGNVVWSASYGPVGDESVTGSMSGIAVDGLGNVYVLSETLYWMAPDYETVSDTDLLLVKYDAAGNLLWSKTIAETGKEESSGSIAVDHEGSVFVAGNVMYAVSNILESDLFVTKYASSGEVLWSRSYDSGFNDSAMRGGVVTDGSGGVSVFGAGFIVKYDNAGSVLWTKTMTNSNVILFASSFIVGEGVEGAFYLVGRTYSSVTSPDYFIAQYDSEGNLAWERVFDSSGYDESPDGAAVDGAGAVYVFGSSSLYDPDVDCTEGCSPLDTKYVTVKYSAAGDLVWSETLQGWSPDGIAFGQDGAGYFLRGAYGGYDIITYTAADLQIALTTLPTAVLGDPYSHQFTVNGGVGPYTWSIADGSLPPGVSLSSSTGGLSGTPTKSGTFTFGIAATDSEGTTVIQWQKINVIVVNPPVANAGPDQIVKIGSTVFLDGSGSYDPDGSIVSYQWVKIYGSTVNLTGANTVSPSFTAPSTETALWFWLTVTDNKGGSSSDYVTIRVTKSGR
jgi:Putative Ig domain/PASTA domain